MSERIRERLRGQNDMARDYVESMTKQTGEYIDQFTTVVDSRTAAEIMSRKPKCCQKGAGMKDTCYYCGEQNRFITNFPAPDEVSCELCYYWKVHRKLHTLKLIYNVCKKGYYYRLISKYPCFIILKWIIRRLKTKKKEKKDE